jgi:hypothetical protein
MIPSGMQGPCSRALPYYVNPNGFQWEAQKRGPGHLSGPLPDNTSARRLRVVTKQNKKKRTNPQCPYCTPSVALGPGIRTIPCALTRIPSHMGCPIRSRKSAHALTTFLLLPQVQYRRDDHTAACCTIIGGGGPERMHTNTILYPPVLSSHHPRGFTH